ncbi:GMC oxidoreductase-domain-containing protein [Morchella snyderi]|nr:GMC oxidoreductase-domain-containing protein [Morchella snyderi]
MSPPKEVDVIVVGGGAAGCIVAGRLAQADPNLEILIVEGGKNNLNDPQVRRPAMFLSHLAPTSTTAKFYAGRHSELLGGRSPIVPTGNMLGGGSSINFMMYTRASKSDYDDWTTEGWSADDLIPLFKKIESYNLENTDPKIHGFDGPLAVCYGASPAPNTEEFLQAAKDLGYEFVDDLQDFESAHAFELWAKWINPKTGLRSDTAHNYVHPVMEKNKNLHLLCDSKVSRVVIEHGKATGIEYVPFSPPAEGAPKPVPQFVAARKLVVVSAGSLGSPTVLERSGVGAREILEKAGVECKVDLPGVGSNYQDHNLILPAYRVAPETKTHDDFLRGVPEVHAQGVKDLEEAKGIYTTNFIDAGSKLRPSEEEIEAMGPEFRKYWNEYFKDAKDKPVLFAGLVNAFLGDHSLLPGGKYVTIGTYLEYPASRGSIHITTADPYVEADFDPAYLSHPADIGPNVWGYKLGRELVRRMPCYRGEVVALHPKFPSTSPARAIEIDIDTSRELQGDKGVTAGVVVSGNVAAQNEVTSEPLDNKKPIENLVYSEEDNKAVEQWVRENIGTTWHSLGTNAMRPREEGGVVDAKLNVYGVENLKVIDLSIAPGNVGSNTYSTALVIGEKGAILAGEHLGISIGLTN